MKMAKVISMKVELKNKNILNLVTAVDPVVTTEMVFRMAGMPGRIIKSSETKIMPLPQALAHSMKLQRKLGIVR